MCAVLAVWAAMAQLALQTDGAEVMVVLSMLSQATTDWSALAKEVKSTVRGFGRGEGKGLHAR